jgi:molecular chaperone DnaK
MTITGGTALSKEEIERMIKDAERFAEEDRRRREAAEARNAADQLAYQVDRSLQEWGDKVPPTDREELRKLSDELKEALKGEDIEKIKAGTEALMRRFQAVGQAMYEHVQATAAQQAAAGGAGPSGSPSGEGEVVEGEIVDEGGEQQ